MRNTILFSLLILAMIFMASCGDEGEDTLPLKPTISFPDGATADVERDNTVDVALNLSAPGAFKSLTADGDPLNFTVDQSDNTKATATYSFTAAADETFGSFEVNIVLTDNSDQSVSSTITINVVGSTLEIATDITEDVTWEKENVYIITDTIEVDGATLTIEAGTTVYIREKNPDQDNGSETKSVAGIEIDDDAVLIAEGTAEAPIIFTSENVRIDGSEAPGDWQGIRFDDATTGTLKYVRIEYGGGSTSDEGVDAALQFRNSTGMTLEYIEIYQSIGEGILFRGGELNFKHIMVTGNIGGSSLKFDDQDGVGFIGQGQFIVLNNPTGFHGDREIQIRDNAKVVLSNVTGVGSGKDFKDPEDPADNATLDFFRRRDTAFGFKIYNSIAADYPDDGLRGDDYTEGEDIVDYTYIWNIGGSGEDGVGTPDAAEGPNHFRKDYRRFAEDPYKNVLSLDNSEVLIPGIGVDDYVPDAKVDSEFDPTTLGEFFTAGSYIGAIGDTDWTEGWTKE